MAINISKGFCYSKQCAYDLGTRFQFPPPDVLTITLDYNILPGAVVDPNSVSDWNTYLNFLDGALQPYEFDSVVYDPAGPQVVLYGNSSINIIITSQSGLTQDAGIANISDDGLIIELGNLALFNTFNLQNLISESIVTIGDVAFRGSGIVFQYTPNCTQLGETSGDDGVYLNVIDPITVFVSSVLETNNGGNPDGDIDFLLTNYPGSTVTYI